jgi:hypothetical protein
VARPDEEHREEVAEALKHLFSALRFIALRGPCCAQARGAHSMYARSTHASHPSRTLGAAPSVLLGAMRLVPRWPSGPPSAKPSDVQTWPRGQVCRRRFVSPWCGLENGMCGLAL